MSQETSTNVEGVEVTLLKPHEHAGRQYQAGDKITVDSETAKWLAEKGRDVIDAGSLSSSSSQSTSTRTSGNPAVAAGVSASNTTKSK
jgi:hypothetical protein